VRLSESQHTRTRLNNDTKTSQITFKINTEIQESCLQTVFRRDFPPLKTRSQAVARIAYRTFSQQTIYYLVGIAIVAKWHLQLFSRYWALIVLGSRVWPFGSRDAIGHVTIWYPIGDFLLVVLWNQASISSGFRYVQWRMWRNGSRDFKRPLNNGQLRSFILYQFDFSYITSSRLPIVLTFALRRTV